MADDQRTNQRFAPEWDSQDNSGLDDDDIGDQSAARNMETGAVIGVIGGAVVGALAGGPVGAVIGGVLGGVGGGAGVAAVERYEHGTEEQRDSEMLESQVDTRPAASATPNTHAADTTRSTSMSQDTRDAMSSPYPGNAGRPEAVQFNGVGIYDAPADAVAAEAKPAQPGVPPTSQSGTAIPTTETGAQSARTLASAGGRVTFMLEGYTDAQQVSVAGTFNDWSPTANLMRLENGVWTTEIGLAPGKHQFKFVVDGCWMDDPKNPENVDDGSGNLNSILVVERDIVNQDSILGGDYIAATTPR